jgi:hypothetical protein
VSISVNDRETDVVRDVDCDAVVVLIKVKALETDIVDVVEVETGFDKVDSVNMV